MSGNQSALLGAGGSRWITNPKHMPILSVVQAALFIKEGTTVKTAASAAGFHTAMARNGATASISVADTYATLLNVSSGGGFLFHVIGPTHSAGHITTMRITVDGVQYVIAASANQTAAWRMVLGAIIPGVSNASPSGATVVSDVPLPNGGWDSGFTNARLGGIHQYGDSSSAYISIPSEHAIMANNMPMLRYDSSLLIEAKCSGLSADAVQKTFSCHHRPDL